MSEKKLIDAIKQILSVEIEEDADRVSHMSAQLATIQLVVDKHEEKLEEK